MAAAVTMGDSKDCAVATWHFGRKTFIANGELDPILSKYIAPDWRCTVQYRVTSDNGITSGD